MGRSFPIRVVVERTGLSARQVRYYERLGLIAPERSAGGQRMYGLEDLERLKAIRQLAERGVPLVQAGKVLDAGPPPRAGKPREEPERLTSLYPVSDRAALERMIEARKHGSRMNEEEDQ